MFFLSLSFAHRELLQRLYTDYARIMLKAATTIMKDTHKADDALQESFMRIVKNLPTISRLSEAQTKKYMIIVVKNICFTMLKGESRFDAVEDYMAGNTSVEHDAISGDSANRIVAIVKSLPDTYRDVLYFHLVLELSTGEIGEALGLSHDTVRKRIQRGKELLQQRLKEEGYYNE